MDQPAQRSSNRRGPTTFSMVLGLVLALALAFLPTVAVAQVENQVQNVTVTQRDGYATVAWTPVAGATDYQIARTPIGADDVPTGTEVIAGLWRPNRQVNQPSPTFADSGFHPGDRFQWRVRARFGTTAEPYSEPVNATTAPSFGPQEFLTEFETTRGAQFTSYDAEMAWTDAIVEASDRVRVVTIGHTGQGRKINAFIIGYPAPLGTAAEISASPTAGANCNVHGNEPSGREGCLMMIRKLAFSDDPEVIETLTKATVLIVPSINGDGRAANTRGNMTGQDLNRDHSRIAHPETQAFARFLRDYTPEVMVDGHEYGNQNTCDLPLLWPRHSNTAPTVHNESKRMVEGWFYDEGAVDGWWPCPYPLQGIQGASSFTRANGLKNMIITLVEARSQGGPTRPSEGGGTTQTNRYRKAYSQLWSIQQALDYHRENLPAVQKAIADGIAFQSSNTGPIVLHADWDVEAFPAPHPGENPPPNNPPGPEDMINPPPCGYLLSAELYHTPLADGGSLPEALRTSPGQRLAFHGVEVHPRANDYLVRLDQPLRGLLNIILDPEQPPSPMVAAERVFDEAVCSSTFVLVRDQLDELVADGGITAGMEAKIRHALDTAELWLTLPQQRPIAHTHLNRAIHLLLWQADVIDRGKPNQGDAEALRALAASIAALKDTYRQ